MNTFSYKKTTTTTLKATGFLDTDNMIIDVDGVDKDLSTLLSDFNGACVEISVKVKTDEELDEPTSAASTED